MQSWSRAAFLGLSAAAAVGAFWPRGAHGANTNPNNADQAAQNQTQFNTTFAQLASKYGTERDVSPTKDVFPSGNPSNAVHVPNYGIKESYLSPTGSPPSAQAARVPTNAINGITVGNTSNPPDASGMHQRDIRGKSHHFHGTKAIQRAKLEKSAQNIWAAEETLAHVRSLGACGGRTGNDLINCATGYMRHLPAAPAEIGGGSEACVGFVYNRYYDIERWTDRTNACGEDAQCRAAITLDKTNGIAGKLLSGSDGAPNNRQFLQNLLDVNAGSRHGLPDCNRHDLKGQDLQACEFAHSLPPIAHIEPSYFWPLAGGGAPVAWNCNGTLSSSTFCLQSVHSDPTASPVRGYLTAKNDFYAAAGNLTSAQIITATVASAFAKDPAKYQSVQRLITELNRGQAFYWVGQQPSKPEGVERYADEWDFQRHMSDATKGTSLHTFHDYAKRKSFVRQRGQTFSTLYNAVANPQPSFAIPAGAVDQIRAGMPGGGLGALASGTNAYPSPADFQPTLAGAVPSPRDSVLHPWWADLQLAAPTPTAVDHFAWGSASPQMDGSYKYPRLLCPEPDKLAQGASTHFVMLANGPGAMPNPLPMTPIAGPALDGSMPSPARGNQSEVTTAACNYVNAILDEWARKDMPQVLAPNDKTPPPAPSGCFANDPACDWDPGEFMNGMNDLVHAQIKNVEYPRMEADYKFCREWLDVSGVKPNDNEFAALGKMKAKLQGAYNQLSNIPVLDRGPHKADVPWAKHADRSDYDSFGTFGEERTNSETWGNDLFGVGYSFETGWEIPVEWEPAKTVNYDVCNVGAGAHGGFEAYAYAFGSDKFDVLDADLASGVNDQEDMAVPGVPSQSQLDDNMKHSAFDLDFAVAGDNLFQQNERLPASGFNAQPAQGSNSWTLFNIPFQITFITVDISVGIGYSYEIDAHVTPVDRPDVCHPGHDKPPKGGWDLANPAPHPTIGLTAGVDAQGELDGIIDASASLAGLAGIGVECDITLLGIGLPANASATLTPTALSLDTSLNMSLSTLNGSLSVYAEALFFKLFDITIISWDGFDTRVPLFNASTSANFGPLQNLGATGLQNPAHSLKGL